MLAVNSGTMLATHSGDTGKMANFPPEWVANFSPESVANFNRNRWPTWSGIRKLKNALYLQVKHEDATCSDLFNRN
jgi:hypothetical protein